MYLHCNHSGNSRAPLWGALGCMYLLIWVHFCEDQPDSLLFCSSVCNEGQWSRVLCCWQSLFLLWHNHVTWWLRGSTELMQSRNISGYLSLSGGKGVVWELVSTAAVEFWRQCASRHWNSLWFPFPSEAWTLKYHCNIKGGIRMLLLPTESFPAT